MWLLAPQSAGILAPYRRSSAECPMKRSDIIAAVAEKQPALPAVAIERAVNLVFDSITAALAGGDRVEVRGFGAFSVRNRRARRARNPKTGGPVDVPPKRVPFFVTGKDLAERVNEARLKYPIGQGRGG